MFQLHVIVDGGDGGCGHPMYFLFCFVCFSELVENSI